MAAGGDALEARRAAPSALQVPYAPPAEYDLVAEVERLGSTGEFCLGLVVGPPCYAAFDVRSPRGLRNGLSLLDGRDPTERDEATAAGVGIPEGNRVTVRCAVRKAGGHYRVRVTRAGRELFDWTGDPRRLSGVSVRSRFQLPTSSEGTGSAGVTAEGLGHGFRNAEPASAGFPADLDCKLAKR